MNVPDFDDEQAELESVGNSDSTRKDKKVRFGIPSPRNKLPVNKFRRIAKPVIASSTISAYQQPNHHVSQNNSQSNLKKKAKK